MDRLNDDSGVVGLSFESNDLSMPFLAENDNLCARVLAIMGLVSIANALLQVQNHRTRSIDNLNIIALSDMIGRGRFSVCAQEHAHIM